MLVTNLVLALVLPGVTLHYGGQSCLDKVLAFLWALYLTFGPDHGILSWAIMLIRSVTTDQGTELGFIDTPDILAPFLHQVAGGANLRSMIVNVDPSSRLFKRALRIGGWGHLLGWAMKQACFQLPWPKINAMLRACCRFMRNPTWRGHLAKVLKGQFTDATLLGNLWASLAKWRYETAHVVFTAMNQRRELFENHLCGIDRFFP